VNNQPPIPEDVQEVIRQAAAIIARGGSTYRAAHVLNVPRLKLCEYRRQYPQAWTAAISAARAQGRKIGTIQNFRSRNPSERSKRVRYPLRSSVTPKVRARIIQATQLFARGLSLSEVAEKLDVKPSAVADHRQRHPELWRRAQQEADAFVVELVQAQAGTDAIFDDPDRYLAMAARAEKWCSDNGRELFEATGERTLIDFYHTWYVKECMVPDASAAYKDQFERALQRWKLVTGNPPLAKIDNALLRRYRDFCMEARGQTPGTKASPTTVRNKLTYVQRLLRKAGPAGFRNFDAAECIPRVPWVRLPREPRRVPQIVSDQHISAVYRKADMLAVPEIPGVEPAAWWRALLVTVWNTGLRRRTLFALEWEWMRPVERQRFVVPPEAMKSARGQIVHLPPIVIAHLNAIRTDRDLVFPWPYDMTHFNTMFHRLQYDAGIPRADHFGLHTIRRTLATRLWRKEPKAAQFALGHTMDTVTREHYVQGPGIVARALDALPQPEAFEGNPAENGNGKPRGPADSAAQPGVSPSMPAPESLPDATKPDQERRETP
jgi:integrase/predicted transcriptional regulator